MQGSLAGRCPTRTHAQRRGFTIVELIGVLLAIGMIVFMFLVLTPSRHRHQPQLKCSTHVRNVVQAMQIWAQSNRDQYPLPSTLDVNNATTIEPGRQKDHLANVLSILIFNALITPEVCISPSEVSTNMTYKTNYEPSNPSAAADPANALWDPSFKADFTGAAPANNSYAALQLSNSRLAMWSNAFNATEAVFGNRGPRINSIKRSAKGHAIVDADPASLTYQIHGHRTTWEGNIGYNDGHVKLESTYDPAEVLLPGTGKPRLTDVLHADDPEDPEHVNTYLGIFTTGGELHTGGMPIWD